MLITITNFHTSNGDECRNGGINSLLRGIGVSVLLVPVLSDTRINVCILLSFRALQWKEEKRKRGERGSIHTEVRHLSLVSETHQQQHHEYGGWGGWVRWGRGKIRGIGDRMGGSDNHMRD